MVKKRKAKKKITEFEKWLKNFEEFQTGIYDEFPEDFGFDTVNHAWSHGYLICLQHIWEVYQASKKGLTVDELEMV
jgi:hypothetical protein